MFNDWLCDVFIGVIICFNIAVALVGLAAPIVIGCMFHISWALLYIITAPISIASIKLVWRVLE